MKKAKKPTRISQELVFLLARHQVTVEELEYLAPTIEAILAVKRAPAVRRKHSGRDWTRESAVQHMLAAQGHLANAVREEMGFKTFKEDHASKALTRLALAFGAKNLSKIGRSSDRVK